MQPRYIPRVKKTIIFLCCVSGVVVLAAACNSDSSSGDGGSDATTEAATDLCDINAFSGNGNACPHVSTRVCFPVCDAGGGCVCTASGSGPVWQCTNPVECTPCNSSPLSPPCPDAGDDAGDAASDSSDDGSTLDASDATPE